MKTIEIVGVVILLAIGFGLSLRRLRKGGPGPAVNWVPRKMRAGLKETYRDKGWQEPFDEDGNRNPDRKPL